MSTKYKVRDREKLHFITITVIDWVGIFTRPNLKHVIIGSLNYCKENKGLRIFAFVLMPSHLHLTAKCSGGFQLEDTIRDFKKYTSKEIIRTIKEYPESRREWLLNKFSFAVNRIKKGVNHKVWKDGFHPVGLTTTKMIEQRLNYIHDNPVEDEIVFYPEDYKYYSLRS